MLTILATLLAILLVYYAISMLTFFRFSSAWVYTLPILAASQLTCEKQHRTLFQDIDLTINSGDLVLLKGENGAGKTSLLRILVGLSVPYAGQVKVNGHCIHSDINLASAGLVYVGHKLGLSGLLSATENISFYLQSVGLTSINQSDIQDVLSLLNLDGLEDVPIKYLSAGQQRRVSLAKLWLNKHSNFWVLDEPFTALDVETVSLLENHISTFLDAQGAVIMTSHQATSLDNRMRTFKLDYVW